MNVKIYNLGIGNYYGDLAIRQLPDGECQWSVEDYDGHKWEEIPDIVYDCLLAYWKDEIDNPYHWMDRK